MYISQEAVEVMAAALELIPPVVEGLEEVHRVLEEENQTPAALEMVGLIQAVVLAAVNLR
jgi:hypothetical protein